MGLDMYLSRDYHLSTYQPHPDSFPEQPDVAAKYSKEYAQASQIATILGTSLGDDSGIVSVQVPVAYWRKANHIHNWFVENIGGGVDECQEMSLTRDELTELLKVCVIVQQDHEQAPHLLPPREGFFFGGYELDSYYFAEITRTVIALKATLDAAAEDAWPSWTYRASW